MITEITEEKVEESGFLINKEAQKQKIRQIIEYQKSLCSSLSSSSSSAASSSSSLSSYKSSSLLNLMKGGSTSLRRLFDMEHTSLATYFRVYSGSPIIKPILLRGSDTDNETLDPWASINQLRNTVVSRSTDEETTVVSSIYEKSNHRNSKARIDNRKLTRKKSFRKLPRFRLWSSRGFRLGMKLRRLRIVICGTIWPPFNS